MITDLRQELHSRHTIEHFRVSAPDFTRHRRLTFARVALLILRGHKVGLQNAVNKLFTDLEEVRAVPTASAYCQARQKLQPELFLHLNGVVTRDFYHLAEAEGAVWRWHGHRLIGGDGTYLTLPESEETRAQFTVQKNQYADGSCVQALAVVLYDLLNDLCVGAALGKRQGEKKLLFSEVWEATEVGDVLVLDRAYADYTVLASAVGEHRHLVVRLPKKTFREAMAFWRGGKAEQVVRLRCPASARKFVRAHHLAEELRVRLVRVE